jgi:hypothetical protein
MIIAMIASMVHAVHISETSVYANKTSWRYIPEGCHLHAHCRENLKSHISVLQTARVLKVI